MFQRQPKGPYMEPHQQIIIIGKKPQGVKFSPIDKETILGQIEYCFQLAFNGGNKLNCVV